MSKYRMSDNTVVDTNNSTMSWNEATNFNGSNRIGVSSGSQWLDDTLYRSRKGRYYLVTHSRIQGRLNSAEWLSNEEATRWLLANEHEVPGDLKHLVDKVSE